MKIKHNNRGFTIIELMIATAVLSTIILLVTAMMISIGNLYYKGINQARIQDGTRSVTDELTEYLKLSDKGPISASGPHGTAAYCIGGVRYTYVIGVEIGHQAPNTPPIGPIYQHVLWRDKNPTPGTCDIDPSDPHVVSPVDLTQTSPSSDPNGTELVPPNSRLTKFSIAQVSSTSPITLSIGMAYGDNDLLCSEAVPNSCSTPIAMPHWNQYTTGNLLCKGTKGEQFCSTAELNTSVVQRL